MRKDFVNISINYSISFTPRHIFKIQSYYMINNVITNVLRSKKHNANDKIWKKLINLKY